jgi:hypothetical protein
LGRFLATSQLLVVFLGAGCGPAELPAPSVAVGARAVVIAADDGESISDWLLSTAEDLREVFLPTLAEIISKAPPDIRFHILFSADDARAELIEILGRSQFTNFERLNWHPVSAEVPWWSRDLFVAGAGPRGGPVLLLHHPDHYGKIQHPRGGSGPATLKILRGLRPFRTIDTAARIEGGAVVADADHVFITPGYCADAVSRGEHADWPAFLAYLRKIYGRPVVVLDAPRHELYKHTDMFFTPVGAGVILLGDPDLAQHLVRRASPEDLATVATRVNDIARRNGASVDATVLTAEDLRNSQSDPFDGQAVTLRLQRQLTYLGYRVVRVPLASLRDARRPIRFGFSYNNVIMDRRQGRRVVYMPTCGIGTLDTAARQVWESQNYEVITIDALGPALLGGGVRCLSQVFRQ